MINVDDYVREKGKKVLLKVLSKTGLPGPSVQCLYLDENGSQALKFCTESDLELVKSKDKPLG